MRLTETFYKILDKETGNWFSTKNSKTVWARLSGAKTAFSTNKLDPTRYAIFEFVATGEEINR